MKNRRKLALMAAMCGALLGVTYTASAAASLGANFVGRNSDNTGPAATLTPDEVAGVVPQSRWTNIGDGSANYSGSQLLLDSSNGALTLVELVYSANDSWNSDTPLPLTTPDQKLMKGIQKANPDPDNDLGPSSVMTFTFKNLPEGSYDVIAYCAHNGGAPIAKFTLGATSYYVQNPVSFTNTFVQGTATSQATATIANYVRWNGVAADANGEIKFTAQKVDVPQAADGIGVAGIQLIALGDITFPAAGAPKVTNPNLPADTVALVGATVTFTSAFDQGTIQWRKNGVNIAGATATTYTTPALTLADNEAKFDAVATSPAGSTASRQATLFVDAPTPEVLSRGFMNVDHYYDLPPGLLLASDLLTQPKFPDSPDRRSYTGFAGVGQSNPDLENFGVRITGWVEPPVTGNYTFFIRSDDGSEFWINETAGGNPPDPFTDNSAAVEEDCCDAFQEPETGDLATSLPFALTAGQRYGITLLLKEATGGDNVYLAWRIAGDTNAAANLQPIPGANLWGMLSGAGHRFSITQQPQSQTVIEERTATVSISIQTLPTAGEYSLQWLKNGQPIPGATANSYKTAPLSVADSGAVYVARMFTLFGQVDSDPATITVVPDTFPPVPSAGALVSTDGTTVDVGVGFDERISDTAAGVAANYSISPGTITGFTYYPKSQSALLKVTGLAPGASATVTVKNVADVKGNAITSVNVPVTVSSTLKWNVVGGAELGLAGNYVVPISEEGFDVFSNGFTQWAAYDETTFVYEEITGDFDKKAQVVFQDLSSQWARAGLIARDVPNFGVGRTAQEGGAAGRYQKVHVNPSGPTLTGPGTAGNNAWEGNRRLSTGGQTSSAGGGGGPLDYPNTWVRLQRVDQTFTIYRSLDGENWTSMGSTVWGVTLDGTTVTEPMPAKMYVGPEFSPENGNITNTGDRGTWLAQIRNYGDTFGGPVLPPGPLDISIDGSTVTISWPGAGTLQRAATIDGDWTNVQATSPFTATEPGFYRLSN